MNEAMSNLPRGFMAMPPCFEKGILMGQFNAMFQSCMMAKGWRLEDRR
jgi:hypothetical protein